MKWLIYGANGYSGALIACEAQARGLRPILAGRSAAVQALATELGLEARSFALDQPAAVRAGLEGVALVLHCAGPFSATSAPMVAACLAAGSHYLDITGEIDVFEALAARDGEAKARRAPERRRTATKKISAGVAAGAAEAARPAAKGPTGEEIAKLKEG